jgi:NAD(P)-dependent dehydrogenase (short-subunit alcohol dehydrogenase family)
MDVRLDGRVVLITGGSRGIGLAIAQEMSASGAKVMVSSRKAEALEAAVASLAGEGGWFAANAGDPDDAEACVAATMERFGRIDVLVNNAATNPYMGKTIDIDRPRLDKTISVNWAGPLMWSQLVWRAWMQEHGGSIINIASIGGLSVETSIGAYNATKAALLHLTRTLAAELAPAVRVNAIAPGLVKTDMARALWEPNEEAIARVMPLQRLGEPADIAHAAVFLASEQAGWITGTTTVVDGGALLHN